MIFLVQKFKKRIFSWKGHEQKKFKTENLKPENNKTNNCSPTFERRKNLYVKWWSSTISVK